MLLVSVGKLMLFSLVAAMMKWRKKRPAHTKAKVRSITISDSIDDACDRESCVHRLFDGCCSIERDVEEGQLELLGAIGQAFECEKN